MYLDFIEMKMKSTDSSIFHSVTQSLPEGVFVSLIRYNDVSGNFRTLSSPKLFTASAQDSLTHCCIVLTNLRQQCYG